MIRCLLGPPKMKRPMETNRLETGPPMAKRMCLEGSRQLVAETIPIVSTSTGTVTPNLARPGMQRQSVDPQYSNIRHILA